MPTFLQSLSVLKRALLKNFLNHVFFYLKVNFLNSNFLRSFLVNLTDIVLKFARKSEKLLLFK